jgi:glycosyltransferase involved in cell wall biosynthesis
VRRPESANGDRPTGQGSISIVLPAFNEEENIGPMLDRAFEVLPRSGRDFEVIVVDDGSRDATAEVVMGYLDAHHPRIRLLRHEVNRGYGVALRSGLQATRNDLLFYTDADRQFDIDELRYMLPLMREADMVLGFRVYRYDTILRSILSWIYNRLINVLFRVHVRDVDCSFKLFSREVWDRIVIESDDFFVDAEIVARARRLGFRIVQKGVRHYPRAAGETTVRPSHIPNTLREIGRNWRRIHFPTAEDRRHAERARRNSAAIEVEPLTAPRR